MKANESYNLRSCGNSGPKFLYPDLIRDPVKLLSFIMFTAFHLCQMLPELGIGLASPIFHMIFPVLIRDGMIEQANSST